MKKLYTLALALLFSLAFTTPAQAFLIDGFGDDSDPAGIDNFSVDTLPGTIIGAGPSDQTITDTDFGSATRTMEVSEGSTTGDDNGVSLNVENDALNYSVDTGVSGAIGTITWSEFGTQDFSGPINVLVSIIQSNNTDGGDDSITPATLGVRLDNTLAGTFAEDTQEVPFQLASTGPQDFIMSLQPGDLLGVDLVTMTFNNNDIDAVDITLDFVETVPAPGVLGLIGLGLMGIGFSIRKRGSKAA